MSLASTPAAKALTRRLTPLRAQAARRAIERVAARLPDLDALPPPARVAALLVAAEAAVQEIRRLEAASRDLTEAHRAAETPLARREVLERSLQAEVSSRRALARDLRALDRWLDLGALQDRFALRLASAALDAEVALEAIAAELRQDPGATAAVARGGHCARLAVFTEEPLRPGIRVEALRAMAALLGAIPAAERLAVAPPAVTRRLVAAASEPTGPRWVQVAALDAVAAALGEEAVGVLRRRLRDRRPGDDFILRAAAVRVLGGRLAAVAPVELLREAAADPSPSVRQAAARALAAVAAPGAVAALIELAGGDAAPVVRGVAVEALAQLAQRGSVDAAPAAAALVDRLAAEPAPIVLRILFEELPALVASGAVSPTQLAAPLSRLAVDERLQPAMRELAAATARAVAVDQSPRGRALRARLAEALARIAEGGEAPLTLGPELSGADAPTREELARALAVAARGDLAVSLRRGGAGWVLCRGEPRQRRFWRVLHELRSPMPDKRQGFDHTAARGAPRGEVVVPPVGMAEVTPTRVPGERRLWPSVGGWGPFVPRVDDLLAVTGLHAAPLLLVTSFGTVTVSPPPTLAARLRARFFISLRYAELADERERALASPEPSDQRRYLERVRALGFGVTLGDTSADLGGTPFDASGSLATKFLGAMIAPFAAPSWIGDPLSYALSPRGNSPPELAWFAWAILMFLLVRAAVILSRLERAREAIPLTIGGWGTRGKSGSERLKAALFQGLGYQTVVKTTGCEAMFIHAIPGVPAQEIFIYRPYDKSTIWEQRDVVELAARLGADVFLWECMALRERFIQLLLHEWMAGKVSTLTNAYPDHEDVMGPSGEDVARVIGQFMPKGGVTITAEEQMLPILKESARRTRTELEVVSSRESDLIAPDVLSRFPYQEHPRNIALVARLAEHFGVDRDVAYIEMADHVVPDLGVLKTYPALRYRGREVFFSNGMSANERAGFLANWGRLGLDQHDPGREPDLSVVTVVNNRADRVARSRVFAKIMVEDAPSERQVVIGTNLSGMRDFVETALDEHLKGAWVRRGDDLPRTLERLDAALARLKIAAQPGALRAALRRMLLALPLSEPDADARLADPAVTAALAAAESGDASAPDRLRAAVTAALAPRAPAPDQEEDLRPDVAEHARRVAWRAASAARARAAVRAAQTDDQANEAFRAAYRELFLETVVYYTYAAAKGDQVIDFITRTLAPGQRVHLVGIQNIKGTGLDFVYRWISIDKVESELERMQASASARAEVLSFLLGHSDYGLLDARRARDALREVRRRAEEDPTWAPYRSQVEATLARLTEVSADRLARLSAGGQQGSALTTWAERQLDYLDAIRRRKLARRVLEDLVGQRVSRDRAAVLLREVTLRQKGGWLRQDLERVRGLFRKGEGGTRVPRK